jgi:membrane-associated protease RseP (regulator of RpoE activity)
MVELDMQPNPPEEEDYGFTVNLLRSTISKYFIVNDVRFDRHAFAFFVQVDERTLEGAFDDMRREMLDLGYVPNLLKERPGYVVYVIRMPDKQYRSTMVNSIMLVLTILSTIAAGMFFVVSYENLDFFSWETVGKGALYFALPLMLILGLHEMGHYVAARRHRVAASLPFFIPAPPPFFFIGTLGAFISLREPIHSKRALMDIGFAGPIAGFIVAIFVTILGFKLSVWNPIYVGPDESATILLGTPLIFDALAYLVPTPDNVLIHPTAFAGWVGFLVTFLNLLPAGQLDGGHIIRSLFGGNARYVGYATVVGMLLVSIFTGYWGWALFIGFIILFLNHPPPLNDVSPLTPSRFIMGLGAIVMLVICFVPAPFTFADLNADIEAHFDEAEVHVLPGEWVNDTLVIVNTGNTRLEGKIRVKDTGDWNMTFDESVKFPNGVEEWSGSFDINKDSDKNHTTRINVTLSPADGSELGDRRHFVVEIRYNDPNGGGRTEDVRFRATVGWVEPREVPGDSNLPEDMVRNYTVRFKNLVSHPANGTTRFNMSLEVGGGLRATLTDPNITLATPEEVNGTPPMDHIILPNNGTAEVLIWLYAPPGTSKTSGLPVDLWVEREGDPASAMAISFSVNVGTVVYEVSISSPHTQWSFAKGSAKNVTFNLTSRGNVDTTVSITYEMTGPDAFEFVGTPESSLVLAPDETRILTVVLFASGEVDDSVTLRVDIDYGNMQGSSVSTVLTIAMPPV